MHGLPQAFTGLPLAQQNMPILEAASRSTGSSRKGAAHRTQLAAAAEPDEEGAEIVDGPSSPRHDQEAIRPAARRARRGGAPKQDGASPTQSMLTADGGEIIE